VTDEGVFVVDRTGSPSRILVEEGLFDIEADNGVIHVIDGVLIPKLFADDGDGDDD
jgi:hypothetical protein